MSHSSKGAGDARPLAGGLQPTSKPTSRPRWYRGAQAVTAVAATAAVFSAGVLYGELRSPIRNAAATAAAPAPAPTGTVTATAEPVVVSAPVDVPMAAQPANAGRAAPPVQLTIPQLQIDQSLIGLRVKPNRELEVPSDYNDIGWWSTGPAPGDAGAALLVGHVDSKEGPAVFYRLSSLKKGDRISVRRADGRTVTFAVTGSRSFAKDNFPDKLVYRTAGKPSLHLVTCGGVYDRETGDYSNNTVVFADLVKPKRRSTAPSTSGAARGAFTDRVLVARVAAGVAVRPGRTLEEKISGDRANAAIAAGAPARRNGQ